jgi:hypothetical protein
MQSYLKNGQVLEKIKQRTHTHSLTQTAEGCHKPLAFTPGKVCFQYTANIRAWAQGLAVTGSSTADIYGSDSETSDSSLPC